MKKQCTRILSALLLCLMMVTVSAIGVFAAETTQNGASDTTTASTSADAASSDDAIGGEKADTAEDSTGADLADDETTTQETTGEEAATEEDEDDGNPFTQTIWALLPPVIAIGLALITKEVYSSLFVGIVVGGLLYANFGTVGFWKGLETAYTTIVNDGFIASLADSYNMGILVFLVVLGIVVVLMNRAGGSAAYGAWAGKKIKTRTSAILATFGLGCLIFVDDYFNCLTVGSVMRPITDTHMVSRAKLSYLIDATAAPVCMIAPISSWAAAVSGVVEGTNGFTLFCKAIPYNFYSLLTIVMIIAMTIMKVDYGPMKKHEENAKKGDLYTTPDRPFAGASNVKTNPKGKVIDLILPVLLLIALCIGGMVYTGGIGSSSVTIPQNTTVTVPKGSRVTIQQGEFDITLSAQTDIATVLDSDMTADAGKDVMNDDKTAIGANGFTVTLPAADENGDLITYTDIDGYTYTLAQDTEATVSPDTEASYSTVGFIDAFAGCDAAKSLSMGSILALLLIILYMICRRVLTFKECMETLPEGFKAMVPAILILTFAWTLSGITKMLGAKEYVASIFEGAAGGLKLFLPAIIFLVAVGLSFATGTSWGTFGILIPLVVPLFAVDSEMLIISISACLAGAVCGDHCSPISDTTIMASTGGQCNHINHVSTQLPYALTVAGVSFVSYILAGLIQNWLIVLPIGIVLTVGVLFIIKMINSQRADKTE